MAYFVPPQRNLTPVGIHLAHIEMSRLIAGTTPLLAMLPRLDIAGDGGVGYVGTAYSE